MQSVPLVQFGLGGVGRALVRMVARARPLHQSELGLELKYVALCDSQAQIIDAAGLTDEELERVLEVKGRGGSLTELQLAQPKEGNLPFIQQVVASGVEGAVVVDATGAKGMEEALLAALEMGCLLVLANKLPLVSSWDTFRALTRHRRTRYETTVGAGLPVIETLTSLLDSGDQVRRIAGCFSGTLGYIYSRLEEGASFSQAVREAKSLGYTEPDPRADLSGADVARKALILARTMGGELEYSQVALASLYPQRMDSLSVDEFMAELPSLDEGYGAETAQARAEGCVLRYVAQVEGGEVRVGPQKLPRESLFGALKGPDNIILFETDNYSRNPLVIIGPGAGPEVTAAGMLTDILRLATSR